MQSRAMLYNVQNIFVAGNFQKCCMWRMSNLSTLNFLAKKILSNLFLQVCLSHYCLVSIVSLEWTTEIMMPICMINKNLNLNNKSKVFNIFNVEPLKFCLIWVEFKCWQVIENAAWADVEYRTFFLLKFLKSCLLTKLQINQNVFLYVNIWIIFKNIT